MGLLPLGTGDWLAFETRGSVSDWVFLYFRFFKEADVWYCRDALSLPCRLEAEIRDADTMLPSAPALFLPPSSSSRLDVISSRLEL